MTDSHIHVTKGVCTAYVGLDATHLFRAKTIMISIKYTNKGMKMTRGMTMTKLLKMASDYTGKKYKRTEAETAMEDLRQWCLAMEMALPVVHD